jgi:hypothetical protein
MASWLAQQYVQARQRGTGRRDATRGVPFVCRATLPGLPFAATSPRAARRSPTPRLVLRVPRRKAAARPVRARNLPSGVASVLCELPS